MKTPEIKLIIIIVYYFLGVLFNVTTSTISMQRYEAIKNQVTEHFACEALGNNVVGKCRSSADIWFSVLPWIFFVYIISCKCKMPKNIKLLPFI